MYADWKQELSCCWDGRAVLRVPLSPLVNNTDIHAISHRFQVIAQYQQNLSSPSSGEYLSLAYSFSVTSENIAINHILMKTRFFGLHSFRRHLQPFWRNWPPKMYRIRWNNANERPLRRWRLFKATLVTNENHVFEFVLVNNDNFLRYRGLIKFVVSTEGCLSLTQSLRANP